MLLCIRLDYPSKHSKPQQALDYIIYVRYCTSFDCTGVILKV